MRAEPSEALYKSNLHAVPERLTKTHHLALPAQDLSGIGDIDHAFFEFGPAIRRVGAYVKAHGATVSVFYLSNVEQYLRMDGLWDTFCANVATLPLDETSLFIRSVRGGSAGRPFGFGLISERGFMAAETKDCGPTVRARVDRRSC